MIGVGRGLASLLVAVAFAGCGNDSKKAAPPEPDLWLGTFAGLMHEEGSTIQFALRFEPDSTLAGRKCSVRYAQHEFELQTYVRIEASFFETSIYASPHNGVRWYSGQRDGDWVNGEMTDNVRYAGTFSLHRQTE